MWSKWCQGVVQMIPNHNIRLFFSENGEVAVPQNGSYATNSNQQLFVSYILKYNLKKNQKFHVNKIFNMDKHFHVWKKTQKNSKRVNLRVSSLMIPFARMINSTTGSCESMGFPRQFPPWLKQRHFFRVCQPTCFSNANGVFLKQVLLISILKKKQS